VTFGLPGEGARELWPHPLQRERILFHFPASEAFVNVAVPPAPRNWSRFAILFDLGPGWPRGMRLAREAFQLFATPVVNQTRALAQPIIHDGTKDHVPVRHPSPGGGFALLAPVGVYRAQGDALVPLRSAAIAGGEGSFEIDEDPRAGVKGFVLDVHLPQAFGTETTISVDGEWHQPWFSETIGERLRIAPYRHAIPGVDWELGSDVTPQRDASLGEGDDELTHVLVLQNKSRLGRDDLVALLDVVNAWRGPFAPLRELLSTVEVKEVPSASTGGGGIKLVYRLLLKQLDARLEPLAQSFAARVQRVLDAWISDAPVEVRLAVVEETA
jgi:type VI secretion system protein ImpG